MKKIWLKLKRLTDIVGALFGIIFLLPLFLIIGLYIKFNTKGSILYMQERAGYRGKAFKIIKFRTMTEGRDLDGNLLPDKERLKPWGEKLRSLSLDELPQLFCVIKGDMSLVGPRPLPIEYLSRYTQKYLKRHDMKPGITGWTQVNGRNNQKWSDKLDKDLWYINNWTIWIDIVILFKTAVVVIKRKNINQPGQATAEEYLESN